MSEFVGSNGPGRAVGAPALGVILSLALSPALAQQAIEPHDHSHHGAPAAEHPQHGPTKPGHSGHQPASSAKKVGKVRVNQHSASRGKMHHGTTEHGAHVGAASHMQHGGAMHSEHAAMKGFLGPYAMTREGSGTSWVPDTTPHEGIHGQVGEWSTMWHGYFNLVYDQQGGPRGGDKTFVNGMVMGMAQRPLGDGTLGAARDAVARSVHGQERLSAAAGQRRDRQRPDAPDRPPASARSVHGAGGDLQLQPLDDVERVRLRRPARRAGARAAGVHASHQRRGHSRSADHAPLARLARTSPSAW